MGFRRLFIGFLAGYTDGDGSLGIYSGNKRYICNSIQIGTEDVGILKDVEEKLTEYGYHPKLYLKKREGKRSSYGEYKDDFWQLLITRKDEDLKLLQELPIQHNDKVRMKSLILDTKDATYWSEVEGRVIALRKQISDEIKRYKLAAEEEYKRRQGLGTTRPREGSTASSDSSIQDLKPFYNYYNAKHKKLVNGY